MSRRRRDEDDSGDYEKPARRSAGNSVALWLILVVVGAILLLCGGVTAFGVFAMFFTAAPVNNAVVSQQQVERQLAGNRTYPEMTADEMIKEWKANAATAADKYRQQGVTVTGKLKSVNSGTGGKLEAQLDPLFAQGFSFDHVEIECSTAATKDQLKKHKAGDIIRVKGAATDLVLSRPIIDAIDIQPAK
jgi:flagellar basal body-associated protein FliL